MSSLGKRPVLDTSDKRELMVKTIHHNSTSPSVKNPTTTSAQMGGENSPGAVVRANRVEERGIINKILPQPFCIMFETAPVWQRLR